MRGNVHLKKSVTRRWGVCLLALACGLFCLGGCGLPSFNLSGSGSPAEGLEAFLQAVAAGRDEGVDDMLYGASWRTGERNALRAEDRALADCVAASRRYRVFADSTVMQDSRHATVDAEWSTFDLSAFRRALETAVTAENNQRRLDGTAPGTPEEAVPMIDALRQELLRSPESFRTTERFTVPLVCQDGRWKVVLSDPFYRALTGYAG